jgi:anaerobic selenocysteine-containing dehydrogenase
MCHEVEAIGLQGTAESAGDRRTHSVQPSTCWECGTICGSLLRVEDGNSRRSPPTRLTQAYDDRRLKRPFRRTKDRGAGTFEPISWDEALSVIDPFRTPAAQMADLWLRPRPGRMLRSRWRWRTSSSPKSSTTRISLNSGAMASTSSRSMSQSSLHNGPKS